MRGIYNRLKDTLFRVYDRKDVKEWEYAPDASIPIYGVYHIMCAKGWEDLVNQQIKSLKDSGLLEVTKRLYVSIIAPPSCNTEEQLEEHKNSVLNLIDTPKVEVISVSDSPSVYEYPALEFLKQLGDKEDCFIYYFHTKGISYSSVVQSDRMFNSFVRKIESWRRMLEYFIFEKWPVAVNALSNGYDSYGCYRWPPHDYKMFSGNFWWTTSSHVRKLPTFKKEIISQNRFYSEIWLFQAPNNVFSPFETLVDLYFVNIPRSIYSGDENLLDSVAFVATYNWRKFLKHAFGYNYKKRCQERFQALK